VGRKNAQTLRTVLDAWCFGKVNSEGLWQHDVTMHGNYRCMFYLAARVQRGVEGVLRACRVNT